MKIMQKKTTHVNTDELYSKQGRSLSIGANFFSIVLRQLTENFEEKTLKN